MKRLAALLGFVLGGLLLGHLARAGGLSVTALDDSSLYLYGTSLLLGVGLYGSTYGIDRADARGDRRLILLAVTVGVLLKAVLIGGALALALRDPLFLILGVAVAQIDPLSVAAVMGKERMSSRARSVLAAWASFDDPISLVLVVYASAVATSAFGVGERVAQGVHVGSGLVEVAVEMSANLALAAVAYVLWRLPQGLARRGGLWAVAARRWEYAVLAAVVAVAVWQFLMLGLAVAGLFLRPRALARGLPRLIGAALAVSAILLGTLLVGGVSLVDGALLGLAAFGAQVVAAFLLTRGLPGPDRLHLALAQQNGITAIILALRLEAQFTGAVAVIAPAILVTNVTYLVTNGLADRRVGRRRTGAPGAGGAR